MHHRRAGYPFGSLVDYACDVRMHLLVQLNLLAFSTCFSFRDCIESEKSEEMGLCTHSAFLLSVRWLQRAGHPVFALSPLAIHTRNLEQDPRASLVVQMPGWSGEANARVTMFGDVHVLPERMQAPAVEVFQSNRTQGAYSERWGNFTFWRCVHVSAGIGVPCTLLD